jgi:AcrR family transcriptional regulator
MRTARKTYHHGDLPAALVQTARRLLADQGPGGLSLREVARRAGVSHQAPYRHFPDKEALLAALAARGFQMLARSVQRAIEAHPDDAVEQLVAAGAAYVEQGLREPALYRLMFGGEASRLTPHHAQLADDSQHAFGQLVGIIERGQAAGEFRRGDAVNLAEAAWCHVHGLTSLVIDGRLVDAPPAPKRRAFLAHMCRVPIEGLRDRGRVARKS